MHLCNSYNVRSLHLLLCVLVYAFVAANAQGFMFVLRHWLSSSAVVAAFATSLALASPLRLVVMTTAGHLVRQWPGQAGDSYAIPVAMLVSPLILLQLLVFSGAVSFENIVLPSS